MATWDCDPIIFMKKQKRTLTSGKSIDEASNGDHLKLAFVQRNTGGNDRSKRKSIKCFRRGKLEHFKSECRRKEDKDHRLKIKLIPRETRKEISVSNIVRRHRRR